MRTELMLMTLYNGKPVIPVDEVCRDFFSHLSPEKFVRRVNEGAIKLPMIRMDGSQKCAKGVHLIDLAAYLDERREAAVKEAKQLARAG